MQWVNGQPPFLNDPPTIFTNQKNLEKRLGIEAFQEKCKNIHGKLQPTNMEPTTVTMITEIYSQIGFLCALIVNVFRVA